MQVDAALRTIAKEHAGDVLVMVNDARGYETWRGILGDRLFVGFGGAIAVFDAEGVLVYDVAPGAVQPTVVGEPDGRVTKRVLRAASVLREGGFPVQIRVDMEAWQRTHAAWITPFMLVATIAERDPHVARQRRARARVDGRDARKRSPRCVPPARRSCRRDVRRRGFAPPRGSWRACSSWRCDPRRCARRIIASGASNAAEGIALTADLVALAGRSLPSLEALAARAG